MYSFSTNSVSSVLVNSEEEEEEKKIATEDETRKIGHGCYSKERMFKYSCKDAYQMMMCRVEFPIPVP
jgi:hypothetical protein